MARRILFVAMQGSVHAAQWIDLIADEGWDLNLFPLDENPSHEALRNVTVHRPLWSVGGFGLRVRAAADGDVWKGPRLIHRGEGGTGTRTKSILPLILPHLSIRVFNRLWTVRLGESDVRRPLLYGPHMLAHLIERLKPDLIHSMEFQHMGYTVLRAKELIGDSFPPWLATNWGSDIFLYRRFDGHRQQIGRLLRNVDFYSCECARDVALATEMGLTGKAMPVLPNSGGFDLDQARRLRSVEAPSRRRLIMVKGYQHFAGRAMTAIDALERCADLLQAYEIVLYSATPDVEKRARQLAKEGILNCRAARNVPHPRMLEMFSRARLYLGVSKADAISTSLLEAMVMGAFPIQTDTSCCTEWITDGESGFVVPHGDPDTIAIRIREAVTDDALVDRAAEINWATAEQRLDHRLIKKKVLGFYGDIFAEIGADD